MALCGGWVCEGLGERWIREVDDLVGLVCLQRDLVGLFQALGNVDVKDEPDRQSIVHQEVPQDLDRVVDALRALGDQLPQDRLQVVHLG